jgi:hypothetical protein
MRMKLAVGMRGNIGLAYNRGNERRIRKITETDSQGSGTRRWIEADRYGGH